MPVIWKGAGPVLVAIDGETPAAEPLRVAFDEAAARNSRIIVLRLHPFEANAREINLCRAELTAQLAICKQVYPSTPVNAMMLVGEPKISITDAARDAALVVVGRPHQHGIAI